MQYFFILGRNPTLSFAEIAAVFRLKPKQVLYLGEEAAVVEIEQEIGASSLIRKLGGTIKMGAINFKYQMSNFKAMSNDLMSKLMPPLESITGKFNFGISYYGAGKFKPEKELAMEIKRMLKERGVNSRWVTSREKTLSSVVAEQNKLTSGRGAEIIIINDGRNYFVGKTLAVQPFKELSARDYGRPGRDDYSGMLPPKLAQIMINLTPNPSPYKGEGSLSPYAMSPSLYQGEGRGEVILDPFCGSGTILTEAALMGFKNIIGCDISEKAVEDAQKNFQFLISNFQSIFNKPISNEVAEIFQCDVRKLSQFVKLNSVDAIVTEPYLGPARMKWSGQNIGQVARELEELYRQAILEFAKVLKPNGRVVMVWPIFKIGAGEIKLDPNKILDDNFKIKNLLAEFLPNKIIKLNERGAMVYGRQGQKVWREILVLTPRQ